MALGADGSLTKPFPRDELVARLQTIVAGAR
jgi:DNA-binding response OmpR family regulator